MTQGASGAAFSVRDVQVFYGERQALRDITLDIPARSVLALVGASGCGKSTLLRSLNRMNDDIEGFRLEGTIHFEGRDLYAPSTDVLSLRRAIGIVFQAPATFPGSIRENAVYGLRAAGVRDPALLDQACAWALQRAGLFDEVRDRLDDSADGLSGGQQQRLCIARAIALDPPVLLMDEPCSALDPVSTAGVEDVIGELRTDRTVVIVTHNLQQAARVSDRVAFLDGGRLVEYGSTAAMFQSPKHPRTQAYLSGQTG